MTSTTTDAAERARATRQLLKKTTASLTGRERGRDRKVRRDSYDVEDARAQVFRAIGDGTVRGALDWIDALLRTAEEFDDHERAARGVRPLGWTGIKVLKAILGRRGVIAPCFRTGRIDPALLTIMRVTRLAKATVVRALKRLHDHGFLDWVRRSRRTGNDREFGPQREQTSNAYFFTFLRMAKNVRQRLDQLLDRAKRRRAASAPPGAPAPAQAAREASPELSAVLARVEAALARNASSPDGLYPSSGA